MRDAGIDREAQRVEPDYPVMSLRGVWIGLSLMGVLVIMAALMMRATGL